MGLIEEGPVDELEQIHPTEGEPCYPSYLLSFKKFTFLWNCIQSFLQVSGLMDLLENNLKM